MPRRLLGLSLLLGADTMVDPSSGACSVVGDVLENRLEGLGLLVEGLLLLTSVASMCNQTELPWSEFKRKAYQSPQRDLAVFVLVY
jgi:hypothetical protein